MPTKTVDARYCSVDPNLVVQLTDFGSDGTFRLDVAATSDGFSGRGHAWFSVMTVSDFAEAISSFPLPRLGSISRLSGGYGSGDGVAAEEHVGFSVRQIDDVGHLSFRVHLAAQPDIRRVSELNEVVVQIRTGYQELIEFADELKSCLKNGGKATLAGTPSS